MKLITYISWPLRFVILFLIRIYQRALSPDHGFFKFLYPNGFCRYVPSCSQYAYEAIFKYGIIKGVIKSFFRIVRCNPWSRGGYDPP